MSTFRPAPGQHDFPKEEEKIVEYWREIKAFEKSNKLSEGRKPFTFYDGPPFATGLPHYGHILAGTIKDCVTRFAYQTGHHVERKGGWDCHGLPVEHEIDKALKIGSREDVLKMGIGNYNEECRKIVMRYASEWRSTVERMGRWIDFDNAYKTLDMTFMESVWWVFSQLYQKGLVYRAFKVMPYSTACNTPLSNFELQLNYKEDVVDPSIVVSFPLVDDETTRFLAWTTTPWTLPSNLALCVKSDFVYVKVRFTGPVEIQNAPTNTDTAYILGQERLPWILEELRAAFKGSKEEKAKINAQVLATYTGKDLVGMKYKPLFNYFNNDSTPYTRDNAFRIVCDDYVTASSGTCIVHQAPAFGEDDYRVCILNKIVHLESSGDGLPCPVDHNGCFTSQVPEHQGLNVKAADNDIKIRLREMGRLIINTSIRHSYPYCWRSDTPLIYKAIPAWFVKVEAIRDRLVANNETTRWVPDNVREGRFHNWLANATDWCISRNRYWGTPLPLWVSDDYTEIKCIGSVAELEALTGKKYTDIHRHFIDEDSFVSKETGKVLRRVDEVFDCWFESGSMPYGQLHYPFENQDKFENGFPADFIGEGLDQTRGWFYTLMVIGTALFDKAPFKNLIVNGLVLAEDGKKMSKSLRNYPDPNDLINKFGADAIRMYLINSPVVHAETLKFKESGVKDVIRDAFLPLVNSYRFLLQEVDRFEKMHGTAFVVSDAEGAQEDSVENPTDRWIMAATHNLIHYFHEEMSNYRLYTVAPSLLNYLDNLTNWYIRLNRDRMRGSEGREDAQKSLSTLYHVIMTLCSLLAPFTPFLAEHLYLNLRNGLPEALRHESVHFTEMPKPNPKLQCAETEKLFGYMKRVVECGRVLREQRKVGLRTPLKKLTVVHRDEAFLDAVRKLESYITEQLNVVDVAYSSSETEMSFTALPNSNLLGKKLGKDFGKVAAAVKKLDSKVLADFLAAGNSGVIEVEGHKLTSEELLVRLDAKVDAKAFPHIGGYSDNTVVVIMDFELTENLEQMAWTREVANIVQKSRKEAGLNPEDDIYILVQCQNDVLTKALDAQKDYAAKLCRRSINTCADGANGKELIYQKDILAEDTTSAVSNFAISIYKN